MSDLLRAKTTAASTSGSFAPHSRSDAEVSIEVPAQTQPEPRTYVVPQHLVAEAQRRVDVANRRLERAGIGERFEMSSTVRGVGFEYGVPVNLAEIRLNTPSISFGGWHLASVNEFTPSGEVMVFGDPVAKVEDNRCDHCGHNRTRGRIFVVTREDGQTAQVGSNCLEAFLGVKPQGLWALEWDELAELEDKENWNWDSIPPKDRMYARDDMLVAALEASNGGADYVKAFGPGKSTAELVRESYRATHDRTDIVKKWAPTVRDIVAWSRTIEAEPGSYLGNVKAVLAGDETAMVRGEHLGVAVSSVVAYRNAQQRNEEKKARPVVLNEYLAPPGEKLQDLPATVLGVSSFQTSYGYGREGTVHVVKLLDDAGHLVTWFASGKLVDRGEDGNPWFLEAGERVVIDKATVKANEEYRDQAQTVITRAKLRLTSAA